MLNFNFLIYFLVQCIFFINYSFQVFNIDDFGAIPNDSSFNAAILNGKALHLALNAANKSYPDRIVLIPNNWYGMLPAGDVERLINVTIHFDGKLNLWDGDHSKYPRDQNENVLNFISLPNTENLSIIGNGIIEGNGNLW